MLKSVQITQDEKELLVDWRRYGTSPLIRDRAHAVLMNSQGLNAHLIAKLLFRDYKTVRFWLRSFNQRRISSLLFKYLGNTNANKLTPSQKEQIRQALSQPPSDYGIPKHFWQVKDLKKYIKAEFGIIYESKRSYHFLFKLGRFSWKLPFDVKRDEQYIAKRVKEIREEIKPFLKSSNWVVLASDETRLVWETQSRRAWLKTNQKTIVKVNRSKDYQPFLGSLNLKTGQCNLHSFAWQNQYEIIKALKKLKNYYQGKNICLIWDNARWHKSRLLRKHLKKGKVFSNFHLINFPPYAPDTNPQEHVWKYVRDEIAYKPTASFKQKVNNFKLAVIKRKFFYKI